MTAMMEMVFEKMRSPEEKELVEFARPYGGIEEMLKSPELKKKLFEKKKMFEKQKSKAKDEKELPTTYAEFEQELTKDVKTVLEENRRAFDKRFKEVELWLQETKVTIQREGDRVIKELSIGMHAGAHEQIIDPVLRIAYS